MIGQSVKKPAKPDKFFDAKTLRQELSALVKEDPNAAANVLRTWIGDAA